MTVIFELVKAGVKLDDHHVAELKKTWELHQPPTISVDDYKENESYYRDLAEQKISDYIYEYCPSAVAKAQHLLKNRMRRRANKR